MDAANAWELANCRYTVQDNHVAIMQLPQYGLRSILARRTFGCALSSLALASETATHQIQAAEQGFKHYLIAKQIADDLHDWHDDMQAGHASYVVTAILRTMRIKPGIYPLDTLLSSMQKHFHDTVLTEAGYCALKHLSQSRQSFERSQLLSTANDFYQLLEVLEKSIQQSIDMHTQSHLFYDTIQSALSQDTLATETKID